MANSASRYIRHCAGLIRFHGVDDWEIVWLLVSRVIQFFLNPSERRNVGNTAERYQTYGIPPEGPLLWWNARTMVFLQIDATSQLVVHCLVSVRITRVHLHACGMRDLQQVAEAYAHLAFDCSTYFSTV